MYVVVHTTTYKYTKKYKKVYEDVKTGLLCLELRSHWSKRQQQAKQARGKSLLELWVTTFLSDWQPPLIFVRFIWNFLYIRYNIMASAHVILNKSDKD